MMGLLETLAPYVPALIRRRLVIEPAAATAERLPATLLLADISGFTPLAERLAQSGPAGAEELSLLLNAYFGQLIDIITAHGGDVVKFAGDALLAIWPKTEADQELATLSRHAAQCGLAVQAKLNECEVAEGLRLSLRVGIGAGEVMAASVGGVNGRWEFLVAGAPLVQMSLAQRQAQPGDVVLAPEAWALLEEHAVGHPLPEGGVLLEALRDALPVQTLAPISPAPGSEAALRSYISAGILSRLEAGQSGWLAELRRVTVLFLKVTGLDYAAPDALDQVQSVMHTIQTTVYRYEGGINRFNVDDKGTILLAAFGLPPRTHEDDAVRALQTALSMQAKLREQGWGSAIGLATARTFCGTVGSATRREYTMVGDVVNLAARLMEAASDDVLCDTATFQVAQSQFAFQTLPRFVLKGKGEPVAVYRPRGLAREASRLSLMVGRTAERAALTERLQALQASTSGVILIEGEAGIGKSRLVADFLHHTRARGVVTLMGAGDAIEKSTPYYPWRAVFNQLFDLEGLADTDSRRRHVLARLESTPELLPLAPLLSAVLALDIPENDVTRELTGQVRADNTHALLIRLLQTVATAAPMALILEDAHWLDSASWALTHLVSRDVQPLLVVIPTRPMDDPLPAEYLQLLHASGTLRLRLGALSLEGTNELLRERLGVATLSERLTLLIHQRSGGNPFFSEELAYAVRDTGTIVVADGVCQIAPDAGDISTLTLPDSIQSVITSRLDRLTPGQQMSVKTASVIGRVFPFRILTDVHPIEADKLDLRNDLEALERLDIVVTETTEPDLIYSFKHVITQEVAYNLMPLVQRRDLHRAVAQWYERTYAQDQAPFYPLLAYHWSRTEVLSKAIDYLERAGEQALRSYANQEALRFFGEAIGLDARIAPGSGGLRRARWQRGLGEAYLGLGQLTESREHLQRAAALLGRSMPTTRVGLTVSLLGQALRQGLHRVGTAFFAGYAPRGGVTLLEAARVYELLAQVHFHANETTPTIYAVLRTLNLAERVGPCPELARAYAGMCVIAGLIPLHALAEAYGQLALDSAERIRELSTLAYVLQRTSIYRTGVGQWRRVQDTLAKAIEIFDRLGDRRQWGESMGLLALPAYYQGEFEHSAKLWADVYKVACRSDNALQQAWGLAGKAMNLLRMGQLGEAVSLLEAESALLVKNADRLAEINLHGRMALGRLRQGQFHLAELAAEKTVQRIGRSRPVFYSALDAAAGCAEVYLTLWEASHDQPLAKREALARLCRQACQTLRGYARVFPIGQPSAWLWQGLYHWLEGKPAQAHKAWEKSLAAAERLAMPYEQGLAHYEIGRHLELDDPARQVHLTRACEIFSQLGAAYDLARAQAVAQHG